MEEQQEKEIQTAWEIWNLIDRLTDLLWDRYEDSFLEIYSQEDEEKWLRTLGPPEDEETDPSG